MEGWIKLYRKFSEWEWFNISEMVHLFIYLLLNANHDKGEWRGVVIERGQILTGLNSLHQHTKISYQKLRTCLKRLEKTKEINIQSTNKYSLITICNYESYQNGQQTTNIQPNKQLTNNQQATNIQITTNNKEENNNTEKKDKNIPPAFDEFKSYALENNPSVNLKSLELKYKAWVENNWRDGNNKKIVNWKTKLLNTLPYLKTKDNGFNRQHSGRHEKNVNAMWDQAD